MDPKAMRDHLKTLTKAKTHATLDAIYEVCQAQVTRGLSDFSVTTIARLGEGRGVPKAQSIRNATGAHYRALIESFAAAHPPIIDKKKVTKADAWIEEIPSVRHRQLVYILLSQLNEARNLIRDFVPPGSEIYVDDRRGVSHPGDERGTHRLDNVERRALEYILSEDFMKKWNFKKGDKGDVLDEGGTRVLKPATINAIDKVLRYL